MRKYLILFIISIFFLYSKQSIATVLQQEEVFEIAQMDDEEFDDFDDFSDFNFKLEVSKEVYDPFEKINRKIFVFNDFIDRYLFEHIATTYQKSFPGRIRKSIRNFFSNLYSPFSAINSLLQGDLDNSMASFSSFLINSTIGVAGLFDVAGSKNIEYFEEDLGQTFAKYGIGPGPYLMLPFLGPSNIRDGSGLVVTSALSPLSVNILKVGNDELFGDETLIILAGMSLIDKRESLLKIISDIRKNSFDPYATVRSAYMQNRISKINNETK